MAGSQEAPAVRKPASPLFGHPVDVTTALAQPEAPAAVATAGAQAEGGGTVSDTLQRTLRRQQAAAAALAAAAAAPKNDPVSTATAAVKPAGAAAVAQKGSSTSSGEKAAGEFLKIEPYAAPQGGSSSSTSPLEKALRRQQAAAAFAKTAAASSSRAAPPEEPDAKRIRQGEQDGTPAPSCSATSATAIQRSSPPHRAATTAVGSGSQPPAVPPPEGPSATVPHEVANKSNAEEDVLYAAGIDWENRWDELQNAMACVEAERDALLKEVEQFRKQRIEQAMLTQAGGKSSIDDQALKSLRDELQEARRKADVDFDHVVKERENNAKLSADNQRLISDLEKLSTGKLQLVYEKNQAECSLRPVREELERLTVEKHQCDKVLEELRAERDEATEKQSSLFREKSSLRRELSDQLEEAQQDAKRFEEASEDAKEEASAQRKIAQKAEKTLREKSEAFAEERRLLEEKLDMQKEQLTRSNDLREAATKQLQGTVREAENCKMATMAAATDTEALKKRIAELEGKHATLAGDHEGLLRRRVPGAEADALPEGFVSLTDLVQSVSSARRDLVQERHAKEQLQEVLAEVERGIRSKYPALIKQRDDAERLRVVAEQLTRQNEGLLSQGHELERAQRDADARARKSERSAQILEAHARDITRQLAVLVHENRKLTGAAPRSNAASDLEVLEADRKSYRNLQDLIEQNETLRKTVARLNEECETAAQRELQDLKDEKEQQHQEWKQHLAKKSEQMDALANALKRIEQERDEHRAALREQQAKPQPPGSPARPVMSLGAVDVANASSAGMVPREQLAAVREEFSKTCEVLQREGKESRAAELGARRELATSQAKFDFEHSRTKDLERSLAQSEKQLGSSRLHSNSLETKLKAKLDQDLDLEEKLDKALRDREKLDMQVKLESSKRIELEKTNTKFVAENAAHSQTTINLQARLANESETYGALKQELTESFKRCQEADKEKLELSKQREEDLKRTVEELQIVRAERETEARDARRRVEELEVAIAKLEKELSTQSLALDELRSERVARPRRSVGEIASEAEAQLSFSQRPHQHVPDVAKLEQQLRMAEGQLEAHTESEALWKQLIAQHEADIKQQQEDIAQHKQDLSSLQEEKEAHLQDKEKAGQREDGLHKKIEVLQGELQKLQSSHDQKDTDLTQARLEAERTAQQASSPLDDAQRRASDVKSALEDWDRKYQAVVSSHALDISKLNELREERTKDSGFLKDLKNENAQLKDDVSQTRLESADEIQSLRKRVDDAEKHSETLGSEVRTYQERLLAISERRGDEEDDNQAADRIAAEMRKAREINEVRMRELELDNGRLQREIKSMRMECSELQKRSDDEQTKLLDMGQRMKFAQREAAKLSELHYLEDQNKRLESQAAVAEAQKVDALAKLATSKAEGQPLEQTVQELKRKEEDWERERQSLTAQNDEWKKLHQEVLQRFDSINVAEYQHLKEEKASWLGEKKRKESEHSSLMKRLQKSEGDVAQIEQLQKQLKDANDRAQVVPKLQNELKDKDGKIKKLETDNSRESALRQLGQKKLGEMEVEAAKQANNAGSQQAEDNLKQANERADKALGIAQDYQHALQAVLAEKEKQKHKQQPEGTTPASASAQPASSTAATTISSPQVSQDPATCAAPDAGSSSLKRKVSSSAETTAPTTAAAPVAGVATDTAASAAKAARLEEQQPAVAPKAAPRGAKPQAVQPKQGASQLVQLSGAALSTTSSATSLSAPFSSPAVTGSTAAALRTVPEETKDAYASAAAPKETPSATPGSTRTVSVDFSGDKPASKVAASPALASKPLSTTTVLDLVDLDDDEPDVVHPASGQGSSSVGAVSSRAAAAPATNLPGTVVSVDSGSAANPFASSAATFGATLQAGSGGSLFPSSGPGTRGTSGFGAALGSAPASGSQAGAALPKKP